MDCSSPISVSGNGGISRFVSDIGNMCIIRVAQLTFMYRWGCRDVGRLAGQPVSRLSRDCECLGLPQPTGNLVHDSEFPPLDFLEGNNEGIQPNHLTLT